MAKLKWGTKQGLEGKSKSQRQGDIVNNSIFLPSNLERLIANPSNSWKVLKKKKTVIHPSD
jgi:hypothetical protein